jgi:hypothetical protein
MSSVCLSCAAGKFSATVGSTSADACGSSCPVGSYANPGSAACQLCPAGKFSTGVGNSDVLGCVDCEAGKYAASEGNAACDTCPSNSNSPLQSTASTACECNAGWTGLNSGIYVHICMYIHTYAHVQIYICKFVRVHIYICIHVCIKVCGI